MAFFMKVKTYDYYKFFLFILKYISNIAVNNESLIFLLFCMVLSVIFRFLSLIFFLPYITDFLAIVLGWICFESLVKSVMIELANLLG